MAWKTTREAYARSVGFLCEKCYEKGTMRTGEIVHHKIHLNPENINDTNVSLNFGNLVMLCRECHAAEHYANQNRRYRIEGDKIVAEW